VLASSLSIELTILRMCTFQTFRGAVPRGGGSESTSINDAPVIRTTPKPSRRRAPRILLTPAPYNKPSGHSRPVCGTFIGTVFDDGARLRLLHQLGCAFAARTELEDLCRLVISKCGEVLQAEGVGILLQDPSTQELFFPHVANEDPVAAERLRGLRFPADRGIAGEVLRCGRPIRVDDVRADRRFYSGVDEQSGARTRNLIATPLRTEQGVIGVLQAVNRRGPNGFSDDDLAFLEALP
jgi:hypothetical protein